MIKKLVCSVVLLFLSVRCAATAYVWGNAPSTGAWTLTGGGYVGGLLVGPNSADPSSVNSLFSIDPPGSPTAGQGGVFAPAPSDTLTIVNNVYIQGDVEIRFTGSQPALVHETLVINIGTPPTTPQVTAANAYYNGTHPVGVTPAPLPTQTPVTIAAYTDAHTTLENGYSQLIFNPAEGKTIVVNLYTDLIFNSADPLTGFAGHSTSPGAPVPLYVTFRGRGTTIFVMPSGATIYFGPPSPGHTADTSLPSSSPLYTATTPLSSAGVRVGVYMEQTSLDVFGNPAVNGNADWSVSQRAQVLFQKWSYGADAFQDGMNGNTDLDTWITFGQFSCLYFFSDNYLGVTEEFVDVLGTGALVPGAPVYQAGYGSVAFDPSNEGSGRMILQINRGQNPRGNDFTDAGINVYGALLTPTAFGTTRSAPVVFNSDFRNGIYFNQRAGINAVLRVVDDVAYNELVLAYAQAAGSTAGGSGSELVDDWITSQAALYGAQTGAGAVAASIAAAAADATGYASNTTVYAAAYTAAYNAAYSAAIAAVPTTTTSQAYVQAYATGVGTGAGAATGSGPTTSMYLTAYNTAYDAAITAAETTPPLTTTALSYVPIYANAFAAGVNVAYQASLSVPSKDRTYTTAYSTVLHTQLSTVWNARTLSQRRGLTIINHNNSIPLFANNFEGAESIDTSRWGQFNDYQPGFLLGVNGLVQVDAHLFIDYIANNSNIAFSDVHINTSIYTSNLVKTHNPAALYTETVPIYEKRSTEQVDRYGLPIRDLVYVGNAQGTHPVIELFGDAGLYVRSAAGFDDSPTGPLIYSDYLQPQTTEYYYLAPSQSTPGYVNTVALGIGVYDGTMVSVVDAYGAPAMQSTALDGAHALDIEGDCTIGSTTGRNGEPAAGYFMIPSLLIDYAGREQFYASFEQWSAWYAWNASSSSPAAETITLPISGLTVTFSQSATPTAPSAGLGPVNTNDAVTSWSEDTGSPTARPLLTHVYYPVYDRSTIMMNANLTFDGVQWIHGDVTRSLAAPGTLPSAFVGQYPQVVGGELAGLSGALYPAQLKLYNSTVQCHESLVVTGVAVTVVEQTGSGISTENNTSHIAFYSKGRARSISALTTTYGAHVALACDGNGYGRVLQLGSEGNVASDGTTTSLMYSSAYLDVYRAAPPTLATQAMPATITLMMDAKLESAVPASTTSGSENSLHLVYLANGSRIDLGWPTVEGDSSFAPATIDSIVLTELITQDPSNRNGFRFDPALTGVGTLQFNGGPFYLGAGDAIDASPPERPVLGADVDGVCYVNYGGLLTMANDTDFINDSKLFIDTAIARKNAPSTYLAGSIVALPAQITSLANGFIQDYNVDFTTDEATTGAYANNIVLNLNAAANQGNAIHAINVPELYETSDDTFGE